MDKKEAESMIRKFFPEAGKPFLVELELVPSESGIEEIANSARLMNSMIHGEEIIPGVRVARVYNQAETTDSLIVGQINEKASTIFKEALNSIGIAQKSLWELERELKNKFDEEDREEDS